MIEKCIHLEPKVLLPRGCKLKFVICLGNLINTDLGALFNKNSLKSASQDPFHGQFGGPSKFPDTDRDALNSYFFGHLFLVRASAWLNTWSCLLIFEPLPKYRTFSE